MPQSLSRVLVHLVFSTKNREPSLSAEIRAQLHPYLARALQTEGCTAIQNGGVADHVHLLFGLSRTVTIAKVVERVKTSSTKWIKKSFVDRAEFAWQAGYGALSIGSDGIPACVQYILDQELHHQNRSFQDEYRDLMHLACIEIDERYAWD